MSAQSWQQLIAVSQLDGAALSNTTTPTSILPQQAKITLAPALSLTVPGQVLRIKGAARLSNLTAAPGNLTLDVRFGSTVVFSGGAMPLSATANTNLPIWYEILLTLRAVGSSANFMGQGMAWGVPLGSTTVVGTVMMPATAPAVGSNFDSTASQQVDHFATFSVANAANSITLHQYTVELLN